MDATVIFTLSIDSESKDCVGEIAVHCDGKKIKRGMHMNEKEMKKIGIGKEFELNLGIMLAEFDGEFGY